MQQTLSRPPYLVQFNNSHLTVDQTGHEEKESPFTTTMGPHLMMDCRKCNKEKISDMAYIFDILDKLPARVGMTKITQPYVFPYSGLIPEDEGVTGFVVIAESHLSFHSFTQKDYFFFDLFSCKPFDVEETQRYLMEAFEVEEAEVHFVERGREFPRSEPVSLISTEPKQARN